VKNLESVQENPLVYGDRYESQVNYGTGETLPVTKREVAFPWNRMFEVDVKAQ